MSKHNYSQYSNKNKQNYQNQQNKPKATPEVSKPAVKPVATPEVVQPKPNLVQEAVNTVPISEIVEGTVVNCVKLNVRENATVDSGIVCVLDAMSEIQVDIGRSTTKWAYIYTATGLEGYCMRQYIEAHL